MSNNGEDSNESLKKEILLLGGNESDLELIGDCSSDEEMDFAQTAHQPPESLLKDLQKLIKSDFHPSVLVDHSLPLVADLKNNIVILPKILDFSLFKVSSIKKLLFPSNCVWHAEVLNPLDHLDDTRYSDSQISAIYNTAKELYDAQVEIHQKEKSKIKGGDSEFIKTVLKSGTLTDKVSALSLLIQESPLYSLNLLQSSLLQMATKNSKRESILSIDSLKDLFLSNMLPDRKLRYFRDLPVCSKDLTAKHLLLFYFEDSLKKLYFEFIKTLEELSKDALLYVKNKMVIYTYDLFVSKPEQEQNLLSLLVNKLGDQEKKIASKTVYLLSLILQKHPQMKLIVVKEVEQIIFRANINQKTQYFALTFLNQIVLSNSPEDMACANKLCDLYFRLFEVLVSKVKGAAVKPELKKKLGKKPKRNNNSEQKKKNDDNSPIIVDGVDAKMMSAILTGINRAFPYSKLEPDVFVKHINMLFTLTHIGTFNSCIQSLTLLHQISASHQSISDRYYRSLYHTLFDKRLLTSSKQSLYLNLIFKSLKEDQSMARVCSFLKRLVQVCGVLGTPFVCASLFLFGELARLRHGIWAMVNVAEDGEEEQFIDEIDPTEEQNFDTKEKLDDTPIKETTSNNKNDTGKYDGFKRDPLYANADRSCLWELIAFTTHFHPTVQLYAQNLLQALSITPPASSINYDPLQNHTLGRFLDRFVYKNAKAVVSLKGISLMQPSGAKSESMVVSGGSKKRSGGKGGDDAPVNGSGWNEVGDVPVDEFFESDKKKEERKQKKLDKAKYDNNGDEGSDEEEVWDAIRRSSGFPKDMSDGEDDLEDDEEVVDDDNDDEECDNNDDEEGEEVELSDGEMDGWLDGQETDDGEMLDEGLENEVNEDGGDSEEDDISFEEDSDKEVTATEAKKNVKPIKSKKILTKMSEKAALLGFKGDYFKRILKEKKDGESTEENVFASLDDFQSLIDIEDDEDQDEQSSLERPPNRKRRFSAKEGSKSKKIKK